MKVVRRHFRQWSALISPGSWLFAPPENFVPHSLRLFNCEAEAGLGSGLQVSRWPITPHDALGRVLAGLQQEVTDLVSHCEAQSWREINAFKVSQILDP